MHWLKRFHDEHAAVDYILIKLEGNLKDIEHGTAGMNVIWELKEMVDIINNVIIPHFKSEENDVYPQALQLSEDKSFINGMYEEHNLLYDAFAEFIASLGEENLGMQVQQGDKLARIIARSKYSEVIEAPKNLDQTPEKVETLQINKEVLLRSGYQIIQLLRSHIQKEETQLYEILNKK
ncbi:MAG: hemerythrin domain-containing protein [Desulfotomaculaceae bacterium]|nr:hemerythrin domain-containing protein [Desulfotomaculaceae bacterium]